MEHTDPIYTTMGAAVKPPPLLAVDRHQVIFPRFHHHALFILLCICLTNWCTSNTLSWFDNNKKNNRPCSSARTLSHYEPCRLNSLVRLGLPCSPTEWPGRKIKVLFAFTCAGGWSEAECQAAESDTAAGPCAAGGGINDTVYRGWYLHSWFVASVLIVSRIWLFFCGRTLNELLSSLLCAMSRRTSWWNVKERMWISFRRGWSVVILDVIDIFF